MAWLVATIGSPPEKVPSPSTNETKNLLTKTTVLATEVTVGMVGAVPHVADTEPQVPPPLPAGAGVETTHVVKHTLVKYLHTDRVTYYMRRKE